METLELKVFPSVNYRGITKRVRLPKNLTIQQMKLRKSQKASLLEIPPDLPIPVSSAHGRIKTLVFHYPHIGCETTTEIVKGLYQVIEGVAAQMPKDIFFIIVTEEEGRISEIGNRLMNTINQENRLHICDVVPGKCNQFSVWASDPYKAIYYKLENDQSYQLYLVEPITMIHRSNESDQKIIDWIVPHLQKHPAEHDESLNQLSFNRENILEFDGGNILVGDHFVLVGGDIKAENSDVDCSLFTNTLFGEKHIYFLEGAPPKHHYLEGALETSDKFRNILATESVNEDIGIEGRVQPIYHLDLFISLAGRIKDEKSPYQLVIGHPVVGIHEHKLLKLPYDIRGIIYEQVYKMEYSISQLIHQINKIRDENGVPKFTITRIPLPLTYHDDPKKMIRRWYWASYNNCIVEIDEKANSRRVWLPCYLSNYDNYKIDDENSYGAWRDDLKHHQSKAEQIWRALNFDVTFIEADFHLYAQKNGSLACLVNCIERYDNI